MVIILGPKFMIATRNASISHVFEFMRSVFLGYEFSEVVENKFDRKTMSKNIWLLGAAI